MQVALPWPWIILAVGLFITGGLLGLGMERYRRRQEIDALQSEVGLARQQASYTAQQADTLLQEKRVLQDYREQVQRELREKGERIVVLQSDRQRLADALDEAREQVADYKDHHEVLQRRQSDLNSELATATERLRYLSALEIQQDKLREDHEVLQSEHAHLQAAFQEMQATRQLQESQYQEKIQLLERTEARLSQQFEHLAQKIFTASQEQASVQHKSQLDSVLAPFKEQLSDFRRQVQDTYEKETVERRSLKSEISALKELNSRMSEEALNLTRALKGDKKLQGNWGEMILSRVLSESGLREGHEYHTQVSLKNAEGKVYQPDVIVHLPDEKDIIIDSKVSLMDYERYHTQDSELVKADALKRHCQALRNHIKGLSAKQYQNLEGLRTLDYVLMFIPIESAFMVAIEQEPEIFQYGLEHNILLVSPTNLLVVLRTINHIWQYEKQNRNAQVIAAQAADLYDKLRGFAEDMLRLGQELEQGQAAYHRAMNKFSEGRGNIVSRAQRFVTLGAKPSRLMPTSLLEQSELDAFNEDSVEEDSDPSLSDKPADEQISANT
ncbi:DNA recombination protein RmuC [Pokkaliibacter sp. CJK22405]|uniref:DNA recombination protein RmuC n=1 Tax=Pokkaliibacter sp. CJK22405 TaxID=3384615 RepID=UPI0039846CA3